MRMPRIQRATLAAGLAAGIGLGWLMASASSRPALAIGGDRLGESSLAVGPISLRYHDGLKVQISQDALYFLDYKSGRLLAAIPASQQRLGDTKVMGPFAERDLVSDFNIQPGTNPHFLMSPGSLGAFDDGNSPLFVFESTTSQVAAYRVQFQMIGANPQPKFELVELRSFARQASPGAAR